MPLTRKYVTLDETINRTAPEVRGVYALFNEQSVLIYYGASDNIRASILDHKKGRICICTWTAWYFSYEVSTDANSRAKELLEQHKSKYTQFPSCNESMR